MISRFDLTFCSHVLLILLRSRQQLREEEALAERDHFRATTLAERDRTAWGPTLTSGGYFPDREREKTGRPLERRPTTGGGGFGDVSLESLAESIVERATPRGNGIPNGIPDGDDGRPGSEYSTPSRKIASHPEKKSTMALSSLRWVVEESGAALSARFSALFSLHLALI